MECAGELTVEGAGAGLGVGTCDEVHHAKVEGGTLADIQDARRIFRPGESRTGFEQDGATLAGAVETLGRHGQHGSRSDGEVTMR